VLRHNPLELRRKRVVRMPDDLDIVLYCGSRNNFVSARVAAAMRKRGARRIWILEGGLAGWMTLGFPLSTEFADRQAELIRLGVKMIPPLAG
jgi:3-mercaptopyruvate sulfurtransferase SseA